MRTFLFMLFAATCLCSCQKHYCCGFPTVKYQCIKSTDTTSFTITAKVSDIQSQETDSLNAYTNLSYTCSKDEAFTLPGYTYFAYTNCTVGKADMKRAEEAGQQCESIKNGDRCPGNGDHCPD